MDSNTQRRSKVEEGVKATWQRQGVPAGGRVPASSRNSPEVHLSSQGHQQRNQRTASAGGLMLYTALGEAKGTRRLACVASWFITPWTVGGARKSVALLDEACRSVALHPPGNTLQPLFQYSQYREGSDPHCNKHLGGSHRSTAEGSATKNKGKSDQKCKEFLALPPRKEKEYNSLLLFPRSLPTHLKNWDKPDMTSLYSDQKTNSYPITN